MIGLYWTYMIRTKLTHHNKSASTSTSNKSAVSVGCIKLWLRKHPHLWCFKEVKSIEFLETCICQKSHDILMCCNFISDECFLFQPDFNPLVKESPGVCVLKSSSYVSYVRFHGQNKVYGPYGVWSSIPY